MLLLDVHGGIYVAPFLFIGSVLLLFFINIFWGVETMVRENKSLNENDLASTAGGVTTVDTHSNAGNFNYNPFGGNQYSSNNYRQVGVTYNLNDPNDLAQAEKFLKEMYGRLYGRMKNLSNEDRRPNRLCGGPDEYLE